MARAASPGASGSPPRAARRARRPAAGRGCAISPIARASASAGARHADVVLRVSESSPVGPRSTAWTLASAAGSARPAAARVSGESRSAAASELITSPGTYSIKSSGTGVTAGSSVRPKTRGAGTGVGSSAARMRCSRATSWAEARSSPSGGRRRTQDLPSTSETRKVRFEEPAPIRSKRSGSRAPMPAIQSETAEASRPAVSRACPPTHRPLRLVRAAAGTARPEDLTAVDHEGLPRDPGSRVGDEEGDRGADVLGLADPAQRGGVVDEVLVLLPQRLGEPRADDPGGDRVDADAGRQFLGLAGG